MLNIDVIPFNISTASEQSLALSHPADAANLAMLFFGTHCLVGVTNMTNAAMFFGAAQGDNNGEGSVAAYAKDNVSTTSLGTTQQNSHCGYLVDDTGAATARFFYSRLDDDGLGNKSIVVEHQVDPNDKKFNCVAIYGSDVRGVKVGSFVVGATPGTYSVNTGYSHQDGDILICYTSCYISVDDQSISAARNINFNIGMATSVADQGYSAMFATDATTTGNLNATRLITGSLFGFFNTTTLLEEASFAGWTSTGFDYTVNTSSGGGVYVYYIVIKGAKGKVFSITVPTGTGDTDYTGLNFTPVGAFFASNSNTSSASTRVNLASLALGAGTSPSKGGAPNFAFRSVLGGTNAEADDGQIGTDCIGLADIGTVTNIYTTRKQATYKNSISYSNPGAPDGGFRLAFLTSSSALVSLALAIGDGPSTVNVLGGTNVLGSTNIL